MNLAARIVYLALTLVAVPLSASAELQPPVSNYSVTSWVDRDGVPIGTVYAIAQDHRGYLWLGTAGGLIRFDGFRFSPASQLVRGTLPSSAVGALSVTADDALLVGFATGEVRRIRNLEVLPVQTPEQRLGRIDAVVQDHTGSVWAIADGRARRFNERTWEVVPVGTPPARVINAYVGRDHNLYLATGRGIFQHSASGEITQLSSDFAYAVSQARMGDVWVTHPIYGFVRARDSRHDETLIGNGYRAIHDQDDRLWVATIGKGLWRIQHDKEHGKSRIELAPVPGLPDDSAQALLADRDGNLWVGTPTGLHRLSRKQLSAVANAGPVLSAEATREGTGVWAGTLFDGLLRFVRDGDTWKRTVHSARDVIVRSLHRDRAGTLWIGTNRGLGRLMDDRLQFVAGAPRFNVSWLTADTRGRLWLGDRARLYQYADRRLAQVQIPATTPPVSFAAGARNGGLWLAFADGSFGALDAQRRLRHLQGVAEFGRQNRLIYAIVEDSEGHVWIGASDGLHRYASDRVSSVRLSSDWPGNQVWAIVEDRERFLWLNTDFGVLRIHPNELARAVEDPTYQVRYRLFDGNDGLGGASVEYLRAAQADDGTLWFSRGGVLTALDPNALRSNDHVAAHPVRIQSVTTEQGSFDMTTGSALAPGTRRLDVNFSMLNLSPTPRLRFRHRLEGFEAEWRDAGTRPAASYTNLSPGAYKLVVEAYSTEGTFGTPAVWEFRVPPTLYQTSSFRVAAVLAVAVAIGVAWWLRTRMVRRQFAAVLAERARMSREIHDTLLQGVVGIALQLDHLEQTQTRDPRENRNRFERLRLQLEAYVRDARRSILDLRSPVLEQQTFEEALNEVGIRLTTDTNIQFSVGVKGKPRQCSPRMENELLRIAHEAIANAVRHSHANSIHVELRFEDQAVVLRVTDDGCGFNVERAASAPHAQFGLVSMRERAKTLGGELRVETGMHRGTDIEAVFPLRVTM
jgi:signal transduction histidine kinase/sugar lactone lactonase YvrE